MEHAKELNNPIPAEPLIFLKPPSSLLLPKSSKSGSESGSGVIRIPTGSDIHHEVELGVVIGQRCSKINESAFGTHHIKGYVLAFDLTARDIQQKAKEKGYPWTVAKGYDTFCPISEMIPQEAIQDPHALRLRCWVDNQLKQDGNTKMMIFRIPQLVSYISHIMSLEENDLVLTGTPSGVGPVREKQVLSGDLSDGDNILVKVEFPVEGI